MNVSNEQLEALQDIRQMMKQSHRFISLSGLSGVFAGIYALCGAYLGQLAIDDFNDSVVRGELTVIAYNHLIVKCLLISAAVLALSLSTALFFSLRRARTTGQKLFDHTAWRLLVNLAVPLATGGAFCLAMIYHSDLRLLLLAPGMLIFYGLALVNGSKYTLNDIRYLGYLEIVIGIISCFWPSHGLIFWALGFGVLHIVYGSIMWFKYERKA